MTIVILSQHLTCVVSSVGLGTGSKTAVWTSFVHFEEVHVIQFFQKLEKLFSLMHHHKNPGISMKMACDLTM